MENPKDPWGLQQVIDEFGDTLMHYWYYSEDDEEYVFEGECELDGVRCDIELELGLNQVELYMFLGSVKLRDLISVDRQPPSIGWCEPVTRKELSSWTNLTLWGYGCERAERADT